MRSLYGLILFTLFSMGCQSFFDKEKEIAPAMLNLTPIWTDNLLQEIRATGQDTMDNDIVRTACDLELSILKTPRLLSIAAIRDEQMSRTYTQLMISPVQLCDTTVNNFLAVDNNLDTTVKRNFFEATMTLANNSKKLIPLSESYLIQKINTIHIGKDKRTAFDERMNSYAKNKVQYLNRLTNPKIEELDSNSLNIITLSSRIINPQFYIELKKLNKKTAVVVINLGSMLNLKQLDTSFTVIQVYENNAITQDLAAQLIFGGIKAKGQLPTYISEGFHYGQGDTSTSIIRLKYGVPEEEGFDREALKENINKIVARAIRKKAMPGCRILVAKSGKVIFNEAYGHFTYDKTTSIKQHHLYDLASITKVAATTLAAMRLYEDGKIHNINDPISRYLGNKTTEGERSRIKNIKLRYLLTHRSGLPPSFPIIDYVRIKDRLSQEYLDYYSHQREGRYTVKVTDNLFLKKDMHKELWHDVQRSKVSRSRSFHYSDLNFYILQKIIEKRTHQSLDNYLKKEFYQPLGLQTLTFNPLETISKNQIVPTENDKKWRDELLHGYVHDEAAAFLGGVSGHAGLFGRAEDLAVIGQLLLNKGIYGNRRYLETETVEFFTGDGHGNHRGLGFDRKTRKGGPGCYYRAGKNTYGHSGYTGTCFWVDPENELIYVFLSNRVHPNKKNDKLMKLKTRESIHRAIYKAL